MPLHLNLSDKEALYLAYMPFAQEGGLFIATNELFEIDTTCEVTLTLPDNAEPISFSAPVIWGSPPNVVGQRKQGIGVALNTDEGKQVRDRIEVLLAGMLDSDKPTDTL